MPDDLFECVARGIDLFDCVLPTRNARNGQLLTRHGPIVDQERAATPRTRRRPIRTAAATRAGTFPGRICGTFIIAGEMTAATLNTVAQPLLLP